MTSPEHSPAGGEGLAPRHAFELAGAGPFDVVVIGAGGAGATAAVAAAERGASVVVLEKLATPGGNTEQSGGSLRIVTDAEAIADHFYALAQGATPRPVIDAFVHTLATVPDWLVGHGGELGSDGGEGARAVAKMIFPPSRHGTTYPEFPGAHATSGRAYVRERREGRPGGAALWDLLADNLARLGVPVVTGARVVRLLTEGEERRVVGVEADLRGAILTVRASQAVILACGGFAYDDELLVQSLGIALPTVSAPGVATGDGVRLAADVGADLWHMNAVSTSIGYRMPGFAAAFYCEVRALGFVVVDQRGRRYVNEMELENHSAVHEMLVQDHRSGRFLRTPSYLVFDERTRLAGRLIRQPNGEHAHYPWSADNSEEIAAGWFLTAESLGELTGCLGLPSGSLEGEVARFNEAVAAGEEDDLGRPAVEMAAIASPPYYGVAIYPTLLNTQGGPRRDEHGCILRPNGAPIPGLYGAGELGSIWSRLYPGTGNISECLASALLAVGSIFEDAEPTEGHSTA